jgi:SAM-dependent methyltransferase
MTTNEEQLAYWGGGAGEMWSAQQERLDRQLEPLGRAAMAALALQPGECVADIGCGAGTTTMQLADLVGPTGSVSGYDLSAPLLARARMSAPQLSFIQADAQTYAFADRFDALFSRFGVMFFADPIAAFRNLATALKAGGRLAFVCWRSVRENPLMTVPLEAAISTGLPPPEAPVDPTAPGPFAFADPSYVTRILNSAGFEQISLTHHDERVGGNNLADTLDLTLKVGPLGRMLREQPQYRELAIDAVRAALADYLTPEGVVLLPSATWIVTARRAD